MDYRVDMHVVAFAAIVAIIAAAVMSVVPVRLVLAADAQEALRESASSAPGGERGTRAQRIFVAAQVACAVTLLISAGLTVRTVMRSVARRPRLRRDAARAGDAEPAARLAREREVPSGDRAHRGRACALCPECAATATRATIALGSARAPAEVTLVGRCDPASGATSFRASVLRSIPDTSPRCEFPMAAVARSTRRSRRVDACRDREPVGGESLVAGTRSDRRPAAHRYAARAVGDRHGRRRRERQPSWAGKSACSRVTDRSCTGRSRRRHRRSPPSSFD